MQGAASAREEFLNKLELAPSAALFLYCAKLISKKRPSDLIKAFARIHSKTQCGLVMVGDGELRQSLEQEARALGIADRVFWAGFRNQSELPRIYAACDALVLPSHFEPWGLVVNEAMACGTPAIVSDCVGCVPDLVNETGQTFPVGNIAALASAMLRWAKEPQMLIRAKRAARERINTWGLSETAVGILNGVRKALHGPAQGSRFGLELGSR